MFILEGLFEFYSFLSSLNLGLYLDLGGVIYWQRLDNFRVIRSDWVVGRRKNFLGCKKFLRRKNFLGRNGYYRSCKIQHQVCGSGRRWGCALVIGYPVDDLACYMASMSRTFTASRGGDAIRQVLEVTVLIVRFVYPACSMRSACVGGTVAAVYEIGCCEVSPVVLPLSVKHCGCTRVD